MQKALIIACAVVALTACSEPPAQFASAVASIEDPRLSEISGLAESRRQAGLFWVHNDSGNGPQVWAVDRHGRLQAEIQVAGVENRDWEDLAAFQRDGQPMLAVADCGDNFKRRESIDLLLLPEPALPVQASQLVKPEVLTLRFPDGPRDCEAVWVDEQAQRIYLIDKGEAQASVYAADWRGGELRRVAAIAHRHPGTRPWVGPVSARYRGAVTAADLSRDGRRLLVLTYTHWLVYERAPDEDWEQALRRKPMAGALPLVRGFEAAAWDAEDGIWASVEGQPSALFHWPATAWRRASPDAPAAGPSAASAGESSSPVH